MTIVEHNFHPVVRDADFKRFLRFPPRRILEGPLAENAAWARVWFAAHGRPWFFARAMPVTVVADSGVLVGDENFGGAALAARLADVDGAVVVAASAGPETDAEAAARWAEGEPDRYFFLECYAAAVVEALLAEAGRRIAAWAGSGMGILPMLGSSRTHGRDARATSELEPPPTVLPHHCPGFAGWPATEAPLFLSVVRGRDPLPGPLEALDTGALRPKKSKLALFGIKPARILVSVS
ncbi:MAG: hypothetical protein ACREIA_22340 [Opitutaceae bacterium]